jgi:hypothetical protein
MIRPLCDVHFWSFERVLGDGTGVVEKTTPGCAVRMASEAPQGMAASWKSVKFPVEPNRRYVISMEIRTQALEPTTAKLTGAPYLRFWDARLLPGGHQPSLGHLATRDSGWHTVTQTVVVPTTARAAELYLAFGAYGGYEGGHGPRDSGHARGTLWIRNVSMRAADMVTVLPATMRVSDATIQTALDTVAGCLHNSALSGMFTVSDGYTLSGNIVPDLSFGLFGVRRLGYPQYIEKFRGYWEGLAAGFTADGRLPSQRVMAQVLFPLGIDEIYSFTGDRAFLDRMLPVADRSFDYLKRREDPDGLVRLVEYGRWHMGEGADWVDWYPTRMEGKTFNFHQWYVRALRRCAELHRELASRSTPPAAEAHTARASEYRQRANRVETSLRKLYWKGTYFVTNVDYGGNVADEKWLDDQVWSVRLGIATPEMARQIWSWIDADPFSYEGVPTRWAAFSQPMHGRLTWFGRLGAGDILARYHTGNPTRGFQLLRRISEIFARDRNVYEAYDMYGDIVQGTSGWGNYTEHCGGYLWAVSEGPFGADFDSDEQAAATVQPRFPAEWTSASAEFYVRGTRLRMIFARSGGMGRLTLSASGAPQLVRVRLEDGRTEIVRAQTGITRNWSWAVRATEDPPSWGLER